MKKVAALYLRLSDEDDSETQEESNSISSQREILRTYINGCEEFAEYQLIEFCDDGYSGTNFKRPQMEQLLIQVRQGLISCILVKDFSRFGRNYIEVGTYLEEVFPFLGIRFISVNDCFDSATRTYRGDFMDVAFKTLVCDLYSKDLSEKITSARRIKAGQGKFITAYAPYGYRKSKEQKLVIDEETAPVVQRIFRLAEEGVPKTHIAKALNLDRTPTPLTVRKQRGEHFPSKASGEKYIWQTSVISSILKDQRYTGDAIYGKTKPINVGSKTKRSVPREDWVIVPNHHDGIVTHACFNKVNAMFTKRKNYIRGKQAPLSGKVRCAACNHGMPREKRGKTAIYRCPIRAVSDTFGCYQETIPEEEIEQAILWLLQTIAIVLMNFELKKSIQQFLQQKTVEMEEELTNLTSVLKKLRTQRLTRYESYKNKFITKGEFLKINAQTNKEIETLSTENEVFQKKLGKLLLLGAQDLDSATLFKKYAPFDSLTQEIVETFIAQIFVLQDATIRIKWKCNNFFSLSE